MSEDTGQMRDRIKILQAERYRLLTALRAIAAKKHPGEPYDPLKAIAQNAIEGVE